MNKTNNSILRQVLNEAATPQQVTDAIKKRYEVKIKYGDNEQKGGGQRLIQPVAYGTMKGTGNPVIRAFQPFGDTKTKVPHWKMFRLDKIDDWKPLKNRHFDDPSKGQFAKGKFTPTGAEGAFNPNGDNSMDQVFIVADFEGAKERYNANLRKHNDEVNAKKVEQDPFYNLKQNIKKSIKGDPEIMKRVAEWQRQKEEREKKKNAPNQQSSEEMASIRSFGNNSTVQTNGPLTKGNVEKQAVVQQRPENDGYKKIAQNGPVYKQQTEEPIETVEKNKEEDLNNEQNGSEQSR
jgi:hypothetical protein